jgi:hypothetical protein
LALVAAYQHARVARDHGKGDAPVLEDGLQPLGVVVRQHEVDDRHIDIVLAQRGDCAPACRAGADDSRTRLRQLIDHTHRNERLVLCH